MPPVKGKRQARGLARRQQIRDAAFELFAAHGIRATTLALVADRVGLTEAGLLHHFPSKEALIVAVLDARDEPDPEAIRFALEPGGGLGTLRRLPVFARVLVDRPALARFDAVVGGESIAHGGPVREHFSQRLRVIRSGLAVLLTEGVRTGEFRHDIDVESIAAQITAFMDGIQTQWLLDPDAIDLERAYADYVEILERAITP